MAALFSLPVGHDSDGEESEPDLFQCGKCKQMFTSLQKYLKHKAAKDCSVHLQGSRTVVSPVTNGEVLSGEGLGESTSFPGIFPCTPWNEVGEEFNSLAEFCVLPFIIGAHRCPYNLRILS